MDMWILYLVRFSNYPDFLMATNSIREFRDGKISVVARFTRRTVAQDLNLLDVLGYQVMYCRLTHGEPVSISLPVTNRFQGGNQ